MTSHHKPPRLGLGPFSAAHRQGKGKHRRRLLKKWTDFGPNLDALAGSRFRSLASLALPAGVFLTEGNRQLCRSSIRPPSHSGNSSPVASSWASDT
ncbi:hypothetical protein M440DRAFT_1154553 [Trichoderma longibrachiatum ATCC 18648]|uniref:Uncharacterized protein n=1 Tax=Trichoderma longibrachiatum ATCC 18648 TaxID=983965 RepID=A0A2T4BPA4_TRILO|nr:hypothetical protein M440DRAFT_1154553 [Trichoderma longibrachiatum ATCC 18648]